MSKNAGKVSRRNQERHGPLFYEELFHDWSTFQGLCLASVANLILGECNYELGMYENLCERVCEIDKRAKNSSHLADAQPKDWNLRFGVLQIRYFVSGNMKGMVGLAYKKRSGNRISYWISPTVKIRRRGRYVQMEMNPDVTMERVEDRMEMTMDFNNHDLAPNGLPRNFRELRGILDFDRPGHINIIEIQ